MVHFRHFDFQVLVIAQRKLPAALQRRAEFHRLPFHEFHLVHLRLRDGSQFLLRDRLVDLLRHQRLQHFTLDVVRKALFDQRDRRLARTKARNARHPRKLLCHFLHGLRYFFRGNFQFQFSPAILVCHFHFSLSAQNIRRSKVRTAVECKLARLACVIPLCLRKLQEFPCGTPAGQQKPQPKV